MADDIRQIENLMEAGTGWQKMKELDDGSFAEAVADYGVSGLLRAVISASATDNIVVPAVAAKRIVVHQLALTVSANTTVRFESGAGGAALTGVMNMYAGAGAVGIGPSNAALVLNYSPVGWFETSASAALNLEKGSGGVQGLLGYTLRD